MDELTERTRRESRELARQRRVKDARRLVKAQSEGLEGLRVRARGTALETRRRTLPLLAPFGSLLSRVAPYISGALLFAVKLVAAALALVLEITRVAIRWTAERLRDLSAISAELLDRMVTPMRTAAFVGAAAAVLLGVSQFSDYRGVAVDAPAYAGPIGATAPVPITDTHSAGSAHVWVLLPVALAALALVVAAYRGRTRLALGVAVCGLLGIAVSLAVDLPQGLDAGRAGLAFSGADAQLLGGFWVQLSSSAMLILSAILLVLYSPSARKARHRRRRTDGPQARRRRSSHRDAGGVPPGLQAES
jgi:hypothetical protein